MNYVEDECGGSDASLLALVKKLSIEQPVVVGMDAPLSYQPGGGQRASDKELRKRIVRGGMHHGSVMAPTAPRMVYLTLRGMALARVLSAVRSGYPVRVVEVHPGAAMCFREAPIDAIRAFAQEDSAQKRLLEWMAGQSVSGIKPPSPCTSHFVSACAAALAAFDWAMERPKWLIPAQLPWHPYDFAC